MGVSPNGVDGAKTHRFPGSNTTGLEFNIRPNAGSSMFINVSNCFGLFVGGVEIGRQVDFDVGLLVGREQQRRADRAEQHNRHYRQ